MALIEEVRRADENMAILPMIFDNETVPIAIG
jgi:hypothetical protein